MIDVLIVDNEGGGKVGECVFCFLIICGQNGSQILSNKSASWCLISDNITYYNTSIQG